MVARVLDALPLERGAGQRGQAIHLAGPVAEVPAREGQHAVGREPIHKRVPGLDGVERVLGEHKRAGGRGHPGVDQRDLDDIVAIALARDIAAGLVVDELDARVAVEVAGEVAEALVDGVDGVLVDLDRHDRLLAEGQRREHIAPAARAHHQHARVGPQVVDDIGDIVLEEVDLAVVAVERRQDGAGAGVHAKLELAHRPLVGWVGRADAPAVGRGQLRGVAGDGDPRERVPFLIQRSLLDIAAHIDQPQRRDLGLHQQGVAKGQRGEDRAAPDRALQQPGHALVDAEQQRAERRQQRDDDHRRRAIGDLQHIHQDHAADRRAHKVGGVEPADLAREPGERQGHADAAEHKRHRDHDVGQHDRIDPRHGADDDIVGAERQAQVGQEAEHDRDREGQRGSGQLEARALGREIARQQIDQQRAHGHPEQGDRDRHKREVVPHSQC